jgi:carbamoyltransferase
MDKLELPFIPQGSILGLNYSGMHDSAIAIMGSDGTPVFAMSLERLSREKQDGRPPYALLENMPWDRIDSIAVSTEEKLIAPAETAESRIHPVRFNKLKESGEAHEQPFYDFLASLPKPKHFVCHHLSHASSTFWPSGYESALCLTYDGGMSNCAWFGGLYQADKTNGVRALDQFSLIHHPRITILYTAVTALLGFTPNKHEGKITGLAAYGKATQKCRDILGSFMSDEIYKLEALADWYFRYDDIRPPMLVVHEARRREMLAIFDGISREDMAATVQAMTEEHVLQIIANARKLGWDNNNICLSGGLFSNVKVNQRVKDAGFESVFVSPPMTDDGTAMGAALHVLAQEGRLKRSKIHSMALGPDFNEQQIEAVLAARKVKWTRLDSPAEQLGTLLAEGKTVAMFAGGMEFGPRALGNRSIIASASDADINHRLNNQLNRTEFMPFAPMTLMEDAENCYLGSEGVKHAAEFMTITANCTDSMREQCPAVVHIDGTARPQLVNKEYLPFLHEVIATYKRLSGRPAIVNTSFNIHEEPIVCSPDDAIDGFLEAGLDCLYLHPGYLLAFAENHEAALMHLQVKRSAPSRRSVALSYLKDELFERLQILTGDIKEKNRIVQEQDQRLKEAVLNPILVKLKKLLS